MTAQFPFRAPSYGPTGDLYNTKSNFEALAEGVLETQGWTDTEANQIRTLFSLLNIAFTRADSFAFRDASSLGLNLAPAGGSMLASYLGRLYVSQNNRAYEALGRSANAKHASYFGIKGLTTDETAAWQDALDYFSQPSGMNGAGKPGKLILDETGTSIISDELVYRGDVSNAFLIEAEPGGFGLTGFRLQWDPDAGSTKAVLRFLGANRSRVKGLTIDGNLTAKYLLHIDNRYAANSFYPSSGVTVEDCVLYSHGGAGCATIAVGNDNADVVNTQTSEVVISGGLSFGRSPPKTREQLAAGQVDTTGPDGYGFKALTSGNCKNFWIYDHQFGFNGIHADLGGSGNAVISGGGFSVCKTACVVGGGTTVVENIDYEGQRGTRYAAPLIGGQGGGANPGYSLVVRDLESVSPLQLAGGDYSQDDVMIACNGKLTIERCKFINQREDGSGNLVNAESRVVVAGDYDPIPHNSGSGCGVESRNNWYRGSNTYAPIYDGSGNHLAKAYFFSSLIAHTFISENDTGGIEGASIHNLRNVRGQPIEFARLRPRDFGDGYLTTPLAGGAQNTAAQVIRVAYGALQNNGTSAWRSIVATGNPGLRIRAARITVDVPFAGVSGGLQLGLGIFRPGGLDAQFLISCQQLVNLCDAKTAGTYGALFAEKGIALRPELMPSEGYYPDTAFLNGDGTYSVALVLISTAGNNLTLSAGQATVTLDTGSDQP
jgi:hypothetical protein